MELFRISKGETHWYQQEKMHDLTFTADFKVYCACCDPSCYINAQNSTKVVFNWKQSSILEDSLIKVCSSTEAEEDLSCFGLCLGSNLNFEMQSQPCWNLWLGPIAGSGAKVPPAVEKNCFPEHPESCVGARTGITISERQIPCLKFCILIQPPPLHMDAFVKVSILILTWSDL